ncbi:MAG: FkbM family methyltransferase [Candidatus Omnitrophota bacterium]
MEEALQHISSLGYSPPIIIDVGAAGGTPALLNIFPDAKYIWIEPLKEFESHLNKLSKRYNGQVIIAAAGKLSGVSVITISPDLYGSSLSYDNSNESTLREVNTIRLDDLIEEHNLKNNILLKVDVQGYELEVLEGAQHVLQVCEVVILEVSLFKFQRDYPDFSEVVEYMKKRNFVVYDIVDGHNRPLDGALAQKDVLFVKENGRFRQNHQWGTAEQIEQFNKIYRHNKNN